MYRLRGEGEVSLVPEKTSSAAALLERLVGKHKEGSQWSTHQQPSCACLRSWRQPLSLRSASSRWRADMNWLKCLPGHG
jgi:hypothetical protein